MDPAIFRKYREELDNWDWEKFRREAAKDILCSLLNGNEGYHGDGENGIFVKQSIELANELIKQLREEKK